MRAFALATLAFLVAMPVAAQRSGQSDVVIQEPDRIVTLKKTSVDMTEIVVEGDLVRPDIAYLKPKPKPHFRNLIELRGSFRPELARTASRLP